MEKFKRAEAGIESQMGGLRPTINSLKAPGRRYLLKDDARNIIEAPLLAVLKSLKTPRLLQKVIFKTERIIRME